MIFEKKKWTGIVGGVVLATSIISCEKNEIVKEDYLDQNVVLGLCNTSKLLSQIKFVDAENISFNSNGGAEARISKSEGGFSLIIGDKSYPNFNYQIWGDGLFVHENLNGKHIKDKLYNGNRTFLFKDGTKLTIVYDESGEAKSVSIYDGDHFYHINLSCFKIEYSGKNLEAVKKFDQEQLDGETSTYEITETGLLFFNVYNEKTKGELEEDKLDLGQLVLDNPNQVNDLYDDPRLDHT